MRPSRIHLLGIVVWLLVMTVPRETSSATFAPSATRVLDMAAPDYSRWLTKQEAATRAGKATKTIDRWTAEGKLTPARWRRQGRGPLLNVYNPAQVDDVAAGSLQAAPEFVLRVDPVGPTNGNGHHPESAALSVPDPVDASGAEVLGVLVAIARRVVSEMSQTSSTVTRTVLTIPEAADATGWSPTYLRKAIKAGTLKAIKDRGWKIRRTDLEGL